MNLIGDYLSQDYISYHASTDFGVTYEQSKARLFGTAMV